MKDKKIKKEIEKIEKEIVTSDINLVRLPIFHTVSKRGDKEQPLEIEHKRVVVEPDGTKKEMVIRVLSAGEYGLPKPPEIKVLNYFLWKWQEAGRLDECKVYCTARDYFRSVGIENPSSKNYKQFKEQVMRLRLSGIIIKNGYRTKDGHYISFEKPINILTDAMIFEREKDASKGQQYFQFSYVVINPIIIKSIKEKNIKLLRFDVISKLRGEIALLLYNHLELVMMDKVRYERDIVELAEDIGMTERETKEIKRKLNKACQELKGKELTHGRITYIEVERSKDKSGWKLVIKKGKQRAESKEELMDERKRYLEIYKNLSEQEKAEVDRYVDEQIKNLSSTAGNKYIESSEFLRDSLIIEYLQKKQ